MLSKKPQLNSVHLIVFFSGKILEVYPGKYTNTIVV